MKKALKNFLLVWVLFSSFGSAYGGVLEDFLAQHQAEGGRVKVWFPCGRPDPAHVNYRVFADPVPISSAYFEAYSEDSQKEKKPFLPLPMSLCKKSKNPIF